MSKIIQQLKYARCDQAITQVELGHKMGLPQSHISRIEQGATDPRLSTLTEMARLLDHDLVLVPRAMLPAVRALLSGEDEQKSIWQPDEEA